MKEAMLYKKLKDNLVQCNLCAHRCKIVSDGFGICRVRKNIGGKLFSLVYGKAIAANIDPIEKKPLFHFLPGSTAFSISTVGCNFSCQWCQNYDISQFPKEHKNVKGENLPPEKIVEFAKQNNCKSISYTYTEPTIFFEYVCDTARLAKKARLKNNFVTNGYYTEETLEQMKGLIDAVNIDLKNFDEKLHLKFCGAKLQPVLDSIEKTFEAGIWTEVTTLVVTGFNDKEEILKKIAEFLVSINKNIPWHISRYFPAYKYNEPPTSIKILERGYEIGKKAGLNFVYVGNNAGSKYEHTYCPNCSAVVIERFGYNVISHLEKAKCPNCKTRLPIILE